MPSTALLCASDRFITFGWYAHLKDLDARPWCIILLLALANEHTPAANQMDAIGGRFHRAGRASI